jgi:hypothetical protein
LRIGHGGYDAVFRCGIPLGLVVAAVFRWYSAGISAGILLEERERGNAVPRWKNFRKIWWLV